MFAHSCYIGRCRAKRGRVAQMGERGVRNAEAEGSNPFASTMSSYAMPHVPS